MIRPPKLNLWFHAFLAFGIVLLLFVRLFPLGDGFVSGFWWLLPLGGFLIVGIGDGHPTSGMKLSGEIILSVLGALTLAAIILNVSLLIRLKWRGRFCFLIWVAIVLTLSFLLPAGQ